MIGEGKRAILLYNRVRGRGVLRSSDAPFAPLDFFTTLVKKMLTWQRPWPRSPPRLREETDLHRLDEDPVRVVLSQPHSTGRLSPKRYENRYDQELQIDRSMPAPATTRT